MFDVDYLILLLNILIYHFLMEIFKIFTRIFFAAVNYFRWTRFSCQSTWCFLFTWVVLGQIKLQCALNLRNYPHHKQQSSLCNKRQCKLAELLILCLVCAVACLQCSLCLLKPLAHFPQTCRSTFYLLNTLRSTLHQTFLLLQCSFTTLVHPLARVPLALTQASPLPLVVSVSGAG